MRPDTNPLGVLKYNHVQMKDMCLEPHERLDDLQYKGLKLIQSEKAFRFGTDAVLLAGFARVRRNARVCDLCSGTGVIALLLSRRTSAKSITALEINTEACQMARRSVSLNGLEHRISIICGDVKNASRLCGKSSFDVITCNPPYGKSGGIINLNADIACARHETRLTHEDVIEAASALLVAHGRFCMVHRAERLADIIIAMDKYDIIPKRIRLVQAFADKAPKLMLIEGIKRGKPGILFEPPLIVYGPDGKYTPQMDRIYHRGAYNE